MTDIGQELGVKKQNIDQYAGAMTKSSSSAKGTGTGKADWEYVHPPSGKQYTKSNARSRSVSKSRRKRMAK